MSKFKLKFPIIVILLYHSITDKESSDRYTLPTSIFYEQMKYLNENFKIIRVCDLKSMLSSGCHNENIACVTFDDGRLDNYEVALPILERYNIKATFFIVTNFVGKPVPMNFTRRTEFMSWEHIIELSDKGHEIGSHSISHPNLLNLPLDTTRREIMMSKKKIEENIAGEVMSFAYPYGKYNEVIKKEVKLAGYENAVIVCGKNISVKRIDWLALPRIEIKPNMELHDL
ncbi:MAG: polysaccharide deacetylase family protein [Nitrososphaerota archaeon]